MTYKTLGLFVMRVVGIFDLGYVIYTLVYMILTGHPLPDLWFLYLWLGIIFLYKAKQMEDHNE